MRLQRGYMVQSQFDASSPPMANGGVTPLLYSTPGPAARHIVKSYPPAAADAGEDESFEAGPLDRVATMQSHLTASTLVADFGSGSGSPMAEFDGRHRSFSLKVSQPFPSLTCPLYPPFWSYSPPVTVQPLRLASRWGPGTPSSSRTHIFRTPSTGHLLPMREVSESYSYDPVGGHMEEVSEDRVDDILRHPIRRNGNGSEPSMYYQWQAALP